MVDGNANKRICRDDSRDQTTQSNCLSIKIKTLTGTVIPLQIELSRGYLVKDLMLAIQDKEGIPPDQQRLIAGGVQLDEKASLRSYMDEGLFINVIHLVLKLFGC